MSRAWVAAELPKPQNLYRRFMTQKNGMCPHLQIFILQVILLTE
jgi:hypothetical protein